MSYLHIFIEHLLCAQVLKPVKIQLCEVLTLLEMFLIFWKTFKTIIVTNHSFTSFTFRSSAFHVYIFLPQQAARHDGDRICASGGSWCDLSFLLPHTQ